MECENKRCKVCEEVKPVDLFYKNSYGKCRSRCKSCSAAYSKAHYESNRVEHIKRRGENTKAHRRIMRDIIKTVKMAPCVDCGETHPYWAMDFDHRSPSEKSFTIALATTKGVTKKSLLKEIEKCDVVCALCHRYRTYGTKRGDRAQGGPLDLGSRYQASSILASPTGVI